MRLKGKKALVTGASGGIGRAIVSRLRAEGAIVVGSDREGADINGDLMDHSFADELPGMVAERIGGLEILCNNAGIITRGQITETTDEDFARTMAINVEAPFRICRAAIPIMAGSGGAIINTTSCWGLRPGPDRRSPPSR